MQRTCDRCGRPLAVTAAPGEHARVVPCACGHAPAVALAAGARPKGGDAGPLPSPASGNIEVDPWSLPPPEDGYVNLVLDDGPPAEAEPPPQDASAPARPAATPLEAAAADAAASEPEPAPRAGRPRAILVAAAGAAVVVVAIAAWLLLGRSAAPAARDGVRVTVSQEAPWLAAPPLAPVDPSFEERRRPDGSSARADAVAAAPPRASGPGAPSPRPAAAVATGAAQPASLATGEPEPPPARAEEAATPPAPEPAPAAAPAAPAALEVIPLPPPPAPAAPLPASAQATGRARAPVLETRSCVEDALRIPRGLEGRMPAEVVMQVQVGTDGRPADVSFPGTVDPRLRSALATAVRTCRFAPGAAADGRPAAAPTTIRLRFE